MGNSLTQHTIDTPYMVGPVHCYTAELAGELVLFDTGPPTEEAQRFMREHVDLSRLKHVLVTHCHIDHYGLAYWLEQESDAEIYFPYRDCLKINNHDKRMTEMYVLLKQLGFTESFLAELRGIFDSGVLFPPFPKRFKIAEEELPDRLGVKILNCPGHSQSDVVYVAGDCAVTGDTLLRGIFQSPLLDVDLESGKRFNNYEAYCSSIVQLASIRNKLILPGHRNNIESVESCLLFYIEKMLVRAEQLLPMKDEPHVTKIMAKLFGDAMKNVFHVYLKASEIVFMQDFLARPELLESALIEIGIFDQVNKQFSRATPRAI